MFGLGWVELLVVLVVALFVLGPDDFPKLVRALAQLMRYVSQFFSEAKKQWDDDGKK